MGMRHRPFYRIVVAHAASPRDGRFIEQLGYYDPMTDPATVKLDVDRAVLWLQRGAQPTDTVEHILRREGVFERYEAARAAAKSATG